MMCTGVCHCLFLNRTGIIGPGWGGHDQDGVVIVSLFIYYFIIKSDNNISPAKTLLSTVYCFYFKHGF